MTDQAEPFYADAGSRFREKFKHLRRRIDRRLKLGLHEKFTRYGLCRDLVVPITNPTAKIPIAIRALQQADLSQLFSLEGSSNLADKIEVEVRRAFVDKGARGGFVAVDQRSGSPCYVQWLLGAKDNDFIKRVGGFPVLEAQEALLENAYTPVGYRGFGIMSAAMALIAERGRDIGARRVMTFVGLDNIASLKGCQRAGFHPERLHHRTTMGFGLITRDSFELLRASDPRRTEKF